MTRTATSSPESTLLELNKAFGPHLPGLLDAVAAAHKRKTKAPAEEALFVSIDRLVRFLRRFTCSSEDGIRARTPLRLIFDPRPSAGGLQGLDVRVLRGQTINVERILFPGPVR